jgi:hypothetical protein
MLNLSSFSGVKYQLPIDISSFAVKSDLSTLKSAELLTKALTLILMSTPDINSNYIGYSSNNIY